MSKSQAIAFFEEISKNNKLAKEVEKVVGGKKSDEAKAKELISLAKTYNFNFTQKEAASAQGSLKKSLSPEEMLEVSGGKGGLKSSFMAMALLAGLGVGGAAMSSRETRAMDGGNRQEIQVPGGQAGADRQEGNAQPEQQQQEAAGNQDRPEQQQQEAAGNQDRPRQQQQGAEGNQEQPQDAAHVRPAQPAEDPRGGDVPGNDVFPGPAVRVVPLPPGTRVPPARVVARPAGGPDYPIIHAVPVPPGADRVPPDRVVARPAGGPDYPIIHVVPVPPGADDVVVVNDNRGVQVNNWGAPVSVNGNRQVLINREGPPVDVYGNRQVDIFGGGRALVLGSGEVFVSCPGGRTRRGQPAEICAAPPTLLNPNRGAQEAPNYAPRDVVLNEVGTASINNAQQVNINCACEVTHSGTGGDLRVTGNTMIRTEGNNHITAGENSHIISFSSHEVDHQGSGPVTVAGGVTIGALDDDSLTRTVDVQEATSVTVAPGISMRTQNGTEFSMGATREDTIDNLIPNIQPSANQESNTQQRNLNFNNSRLQRMLAWAMERFGLSGQDLIDFVQRYFIQGG